MKELTKEELKILNKISRYDNDDWGYEIDTLLQIYNMDIDVVGQKIRNIITEKLRYYYNVFLSDWEFIEEEVNYTLKLTKLVRKEQNENVINED